MWCLRSPKALLLGLENSQYRVSEDADCPYSRGNANVGPFTSAFCRYITHTNTAFVDTGWGRLRLLITLPDGVKYQHDAYNLTEGGVWYLQRHLRLQPQPSAARGAWRGSL